MKYYFFVQKFELHGDQMMVTEIVNLNHHESYSLYKKRHVIAYEYGLSVCINDVRVYNNDIVFCETFTWVKNFALENFATKPKTC